MNETIKKISTKHQFKCPEFPTTNETLKETWLLIVINMLETDNFVTIY